MHFKAAVQGPEAERPRSKAEKLFLTIQHPKPKSQTRPPKPHSSQLAPRTSTLALRTSHPAPRTSRLLSPARARELTTKLRGELSELAFLFKATGLGFVVSKPYGDSQRYDFIVDSHGWLSRVQVKCSTTLLNGLYHVNSHRRTNRRAVPYSPREVDFLAAHIIPEDTWYILPISVVTSRTSLLFAPEGYPHGPGLYATYKEAWPLLRPPPSLSC